MESFYEFLVEAAHRLPNVPVGHKEGRVHGHSFRIEIHIATSPRDGALIDTSDIRRAFKPIHEKIDHHFLNEIKGLENPTSENLARWIWVQLAPELSSLSKVAVRESRYSGCIYRGE